MKLKREDIDKYATEDEKVFLVNESIKGDIKVVNSKIKELEILISNLDLENDKKAHRQQIKLHREIEWLRALKKEIRAGRTGWMS
jgi:hypothetical protein